jgi:hypothetical protein
VALGTPTAAVAPPADDGDPVGVDVGVGDLEQRVDQPSQRTDIERPRVRPTPRQPERNRDDHASSGPDDVEEAPRDGLRVRGIGESVVQPRVVEHLTTGRRGGQVLELHEAVAVRFERRREGSAETGDGAARRKMLRKPGLEGFRS